MCYLITPWSSANVYHKVVGTLYALTRVRASRAHKEVLSSAVRCVASAQWTRKALRARKLTRSLDIRRKSRNILRTAQGGIRQYQRVSPLARGVHPFGRCQVSVITCGAFRLDALRVVLTFVVPHKECD